jgi:hypothetical protein
MQRKPEADDSREKKKYEKSWEVRHGSGQGLMAGCEAFLD